MKRSPLKRGKRLRKKSGKRKEKQKLDLELKPQIHERDGWRCIRCGTDKFLQAAHVWPKGKYGKLRYVPENLMTLCKGCHFWWHNDCPIAPTDWFRGLYPDRAALLQELKLK